MRIYLKFEKMLNKIIDIIWILFIRIHELKNIWSKRKLWKKVKLTDKQKREIDDFYKKNYGKKVRYWWHRLYQSYTGNFDYRYIPEYIFSTKIEPRGNRRLNVMPYEDKNMISIIFNEKFIKIPKTYIMCVNGRFFDENRYIISKEEAIKRLKLLNGGSYDAVIKKTVDTSSGKDVHLVSMKNGIDVNSRKSIDEIISLMGNNFLIQEKIVQHSSFSKLYDKSVNTLRVITYILKEKIYVAPIVLRIGKEGAIVDNAHAGGMFIAVSDNGKLREEAFTENQKRFKKHPDTNIVFKDYQLPYIDKVKEYAINLHKNIPMLDYVSWDFTINNNDEIVLIEANLCSQAVWISQMAHGTAFFGDNTAEILSII